MKITKTFHYRLDLNNNQKTACRQFSGACRFTYNYGLTRAIRVYEKYKKSISYSELCKHVTVLKKATETSWLTQVHSQALQQSLKDLELAFKHFFRRTKKGGIPGFPRFKKRGIKDSFRYPQGVKVRERHIFLPKIGWVRYYNSRSIEGTIRQTTIKRSGKHWFASIVCEIEKDVVVVEKNEDNAIGIDVGIKNFAVLSNGTAIENPCHLKNKLYRLKKSQRLLSRKQKGSNNRKKQAAKVAKHHIKIKNSRKDFSHKLSTCIVKNHDVIAVESLNISGMVKNRKLSRSIADAGWHIFISMLEYKSEWYGKHFVKIAQFFPSTKMCSSCNSKQCMPLSVRTYRCSSCGFVMDRDLNASINIRSAGLAVLNACGEFSSG